MNKYDLNKNSKILVLLSEYNSSGVLTSKYISVLLNCSRKTSYKYITILKSITPDSTLLVADNLPAVLVDNLNCSNKIYKFLAYLKNKDGKVSKEDIIQHNISNFEYQYIIKLYKKYSVTTVTEHKNTKVLTTAILSKCM